MQPNLLKLHHYLLTEKIININSKKAKLTLKINVYVKITAFYNGEILNDYLIAFAASNLSTCSH